MFIHHLSCFLTEGKATGQPKGKNEPRSVSDVSKYIKELRRKKQLNQDSLWKVAFSWIDRYLEKKAPSLCSNWEDMEFAIWLLHKFLQNDNPKFIRDEWMFMYGDVREDEHLSPEQLQMKNFYISVLKWRRSLLLQKSGFAEQIECKVKPSVIEEVKRAFVGIEKVPSPTELINSILRPEPIIDPEALAVLQLIVCTGLKYFGEFKWDILFDHLICNGERFCALHKTIDDHSPGTHGK